MSHDNSHIQHDPDVSLMTLSHEVLQVVRSPEVRVDLCDVPLPVSMVTLVSIVRDGRDPDGIDPQTLNVVQLTNDPLERTPTVVRQV